MSRRAFLYGHPVAHSISPSIHNAAFRAAGLSVEYQLRDVPPDGLPAAVADLRDPSVLGCNVTVPHKEAVLGLVDQVDDVASSIGAANTIHNLGGRLWATNTDAVGFARSLAEAGIETAGAAVVLLGAGGSARAVSEALLSRGLQTLTIANRSLPRAEALAGHLRTRYPQTGRIEAYPLEHLDETQMADCTLVVNTTTVGLHGDDTPLPPQLLPRHGAVVDIIYNPRRTRLLREAEQKGLPTLNGLGMLVHQAAAAWEIWTGRLAPLPLMWTAARTALGHQG